MFGFYLCPEEGSTPVLNSLRSLRTRCLDVRIFFHKFKNIYSLFSSPQENKASCFLSEHKKTALSFGFYLCPEEGSTPVLNSLRSLRTRRLDVRIFFHKFKNIYLLFSSPQENKAVCFLSEHKKTALSFGFYLCPEEGSNLHRLLY